MKFSFIIPTVKQTTLVRDCIASLRKHETDTNQYEIIVVDDGSDSHTQAWLKDYCNREGVRLFVKKENKGFAHTVNVGLVNARGQYLILLNNDVLIMQEFLRHLERSFQLDDRIGIVGAKLLYPDMKVQHAGVVRAPRSATFIHVNKHQPRTAGVVCRSKYCISVTGALYAIRRQAFETIGSFNEEYFLACEDTEYSLRAWHKGWRVWYAAEIEAVHQEGGTRGNTDQIKIRKGPQWFLRERETFAKFIVDMKKFNVEQYETWVSSLNKGVSLDEESSKADFSRVLIKRSGALGDVILTTPVTRRLREELGPNAIIHVATNSGSAYMHNPHINGIFPASHSHANYDRVIDLDLVYERDPEQHVIDAYSRLVFGDVDYDKTTVLQPSEEDFQLVDHVLASAGVDTKKAVVMHMAVTWKNRTLPLESWRQVVNQLTAAGHTVLLIGSGSDYSLAGPGIVNFLRKFTLHQIAALVSRVKCFVGNDSGMLHVAGTTATPIVGIFTSALGAYRIPYRNGVYGGGVTVVEPDIECKGCLHKEKPPVVYADCRRGDFACLGLIKPEQVATAVLEASR